MSIASDEDTSAAGLSHLQVSAESSGSGAGSHDHSSHAAHEVDVQQEPTNTDHTSARARPSLLTISLSAGKAASTSSTSVATISRTRRSDTNLSIVTGRSSPSSKSIREKPHSSKPIDRVSLQVPSLPASPTSSKQAAYELPRTATKSLTEDPSLGSSTNATEDTISVQDEPDFHAPPSLATHRNPSFVDTELNQDDEQVIVSWPLQGAEEDPRELLREQLRRSESARLLSFRDRVRTDSYRSTKSVSSTIAADDTASGISRSTDVYHAGDTSPAYDTFGPESIAASEASVSRPRRYFVLTSAGKPVFASRPNWRSKRKQQNQTRPGDEIPMDNSPAEEEDPEETLTSLVGVIQAIISLYAVENDMIRYIDAGDLKIAFYLKAPMYLVAVSDIGEPESLLRTHLEYLHLAILSITTQSSISSIFKERSNFDLRRLLAGTENILHGLLESLQETSAGGDFTFQAVSGALKVVPFLTGDEQAVRGSDKGAITTGEQNHTLRDECTKALRPPIKHEGILYALLVSHSSLITLLRPKDHSIYPADLHILLSTISSTDALRTPNSESWIPICLPRFNSRGFLHAFISYIGDDAHGGESGRPSPNMQEEPKRDDLGLGIILLTADKEGFFDMKAWKDHIIAKLSGDTGELGNSKILPMRSTLYERLRRAILPERGFSGDSPRQTNFTSTLSIRDQSTILTSRHAPHIPPIRHFWYKSKTHVQTFTASIDGTSNTSNEAAIDSLSLQKTILQYLHIREALHNSANRARGDGAARLVYIVNSAEAILGLSTSTYELYASFPPLVPKKVATEAAHALARWVRKNDSRIFLVNAASF